MLFFIRLFSAFCLYVVLTQGNVLLDPVSNAIVVFGYRSFLVFTPLVATYIKKFRIASVFLVALIGACFFKMHLFFYGSILFSFGLSVGGLIIKQKAAESAHTAAWNKVALCLGNIAVGYLITISICKFNYWEICIATLLITILLALVIDLKTPVIIQAPADKDSKNSYQKQFIYTVCWLLMGAAIGIRIFGIYAILPQYLISSIGYLPPWYGKLLIIYSCLVIITQAPAISKKISFSLNISLLVLAVSIVLLSFPSRFHLATFIGAFIWCFLLAMEEIFAPYLDYHASQNRSIFAKEVGISLGGGASVLLMRVAHNSLLIGIIGLTLIVLGRAFLPTKNAERLPITL